MNLEIRAAKIEELDASIECAIRSFGGSDRLFTNIVKNDPNFNIDNIRVCLLDGQVVSVVNIFDRQMRIGSCTVRMGGIGSVGTLPEHRKNGYSSLVLRDCVRYMKESGFDISILFTGIASFYAKLGWVLYPRYHFLAPIPPTSEELKEKKELKEKEEKIEPAPKFKVHQFEMDSELDQVMNIYERFNAFRTGSLVRDEKFWRNHYTWRGVDPNLFLVVELDNRVVAYIRGSMAKESVEVHELGSIGSIDESQLALEELFVEYVKRAQLEGKPQIHALVPSETVPILEKIGLKHRRREEYWTMIKVINYHSLLSKVIPLLEERLKKSEFSGYNGSLGLSYESGNATLRISSGEVKVSKQSKAQIKLDLSQEQFLKLLLGNINAEQVAYSNNLTLQEEHLRLIDVLFPHDEFVFYRNDGF